MVRRHPEMVSSIAVHPELGPLEGVDDLKSWVTTSPDWASASVLHLSSVFEPEVPVRAFWPRQATAHGVLTAVTVYDLIPDVFPGWYLEDPGSAVVGGAAGKLCAPPTRADPVGIGQTGHGGAARRPRETRLGHRQRHLRSLPPPRVRLVAFETARRGVEGLEPGFVFYQGAFNRRKNVDGLLEAYAQLPRTLVDRHQLVIACDVAP